MSVPKSPKLVPPRKSVELEDPGAHELEASENEDEFADAQEERQSLSVPSSPIPITRVEKVDDRLSHGEVPGTEAHAVRAEDAQPDDVRIVPDRGPSETDGDERPQPARSADVPMTVVEKVDMNSPSHGEVPGTAAYAKRTADAVPDIVKSADPSPAGTPGTTSPTFEPHATEQVPTTIVTKVDSEPSHGEVPGTEAFEKRKGDASPDAVETKEAAVRDPTAEPSLEPYPIAADGGFGSMAPSESDEGSEHAEIPAADSSNYVVAEDDEFGDDFDDFEAGEQNEDFGDFDETLRATDGPDSLKEAAPSVPAADIPFNVFDFSDLDSLDNILDASHPYLDTMFPSTQEPYPDPSPLASNFRSVFLNERSVSLWSQLVTPPPLQPPDWVRSRIRRLFLVSLGVPVDLDEILPASKQKKLVLPSIHARSDSPASPSRRAGPRDPRKPDNASSTSLDKTDGPSTKGKRRKGPPEPPEIDLRAAKLLCATTEAALSNMTDEELQAHTAQLEAYEQRASEVLEYWLKRQDSALGDKEAFEGVIENLVKHARRVRK